MNSHLNRWKNVNSTGIKLKSEH